MPPLRSLSRLLYLLAIAVLIAGTIALVLEWRTLAPATVIHALQSLLGSAAANAIVWLAAAAWLAFALLARWLDALPPKRRGLAKANAVERPMASSPQEPLGTPSGRRSSVDRLRLEALMKGRRPETAAFLDQAIAMAVETGASDIHFQPAGAEASLTFRTRGDLREVARYPAEGHPDLVRRLKVLAEMPPYVTAEPQDGRLAMTTPLGRVEIRLSTVPAQDGERVALRLAGDAEARPFNALGLLPDDRSRISQLLSEPQGMIVLTGPTGCGKTTTLYSALQYIHEQRGQSTSIASIEDPVEVDLPFIHQVPIDRARGMTFAGALRSVLRQDPNILMVGEIRDSETAKTAIQAGLSGHLILTTLHAESTLGVFPRLVDLGAEPFLAASATLACISQRLARRLCPSCRHPRSIHAQEREYVKAFGLEESEFYTAEGCSECERRGTDGRVAVFEILILDSELRRRIAAQASLDDLPRGAGYTPFAESALRLAATGEISLWEALQFRADRLRVAVAPGESVDSAHGATAP